MKIQAGRVERKSVPNFPGRRAEQFAEHPDAGVRSTVVAAGRRDSITTLARHYAAEETHDLSQWVEKKTWIISFKHGLYIRPWFI